MGCLVEGDRNVGISGGLDNIRELDNLLSSNIQVIVGVDLETRFGNLIRMISQ